MRLEGLKTAVLIFLIGLSMFLTLRIWNYQPDYDDIDQRIIEAKLDGIEETKKSIIEPSLIAFIQNNDIQGLASKEKEKELYRNIQEWSLYEFDTMATQFNPNNQTERIEIIFPTVLPIKIVRDIFTVDPSEDLPSTSFDRIHIWLSEEQASRQAQFINTKNHTIISANIQNITQVRNQLKGVKENREMVNYLVYSSDNEVPIYLPSEFTMYERPFQTNITSPRLLRNVLFDNPSAVRNSKNTIGADIYTDGTRIMEVFSNHMEYTFPITSSDSAIIEGRQLIDQTLEFVNLHQGWTTEGNDAYKLYDLDVENSTVEYRLTYDGYPVFENSDYSTISVTMKDQIVHQYNRPLIKFKNSFAGQKVDDLYSAEDVIFYLQQNKSYSSQMIEDIAIGYRIEEQQGYIFNLSPAWFIKSYGGWREIVFEDPLSGEGGVSGAMGSN